MIELGCYKVLEEFWADGFRFEQGNLLDVISYVKHKSITVELFAGYRFTIPWHRLSSLEIYWEN